jgi:hypothetical protein
MKNKALFLLLLAGLAAGCRFRSSKDNDNDDNDTTSDAVIQGGGSAVYNLDNNAAVKTAQLNMEAGALMINLSDTTGKLFNAVVKNTARKFQLSHQTTGDGEVVNFISKGHDHKFHDDSARADLRLNANLQWDIKAKLGATQCDFDLSKFKINKLDLSCAAAELNVKLAPVLADTYVQINASLGDLTIRIPQGAACEVHVESTLADNDFPGFVKKDDNRYETPDFATAKNKIHINANFSLSSFKIERY